MHRIMHRVNTITMLRETPTIFGVEIDIRSNTDSLILHHDPFQGRDRCARVSLCLIISANQASVAPDTLSSFD